ncbi:discoidin domain-containing protein [Paludisphaera rhizosphaerae]|uniref:discoidin domain-containing protein n=1 Tax=Paludisphaera rhizosphaerae TaxID=2711216 RepID=UPI0013ED05CA|nr:discoidin domain-containing protein [Paludisphaera rhizosphaerae]
MKKSRARRPRRFAPGVAALEERRLLSLSAVYLGQDGHDYVGTEGTLVQQSPNDYQDVHIRLTGMSQPASSVVSVQVQRFGGGAWSWSTSGGKNAMFLPDSTNSQVGDVFFEPYFADPAGTNYQAIIVRYANGSTEATQVYSTSAVDPNLRMPGTQVTATFLGQDGQDWTASTIAVGPDGYQDVHIALAHLSYGASATVTVTAATNPPRTWQTGVNPNGSWNAELLNRPGSNETLGTTADVFFSSDVNLQGVPLTVTVTYDHWNPNYQSYTNRSGKTDTATITAGATNPTLAMPAAPVSNFATVSAASLPQSTSYPGLSHAALTAASLGSQTFATVQSAVLSDQSGNAWVYYRSGAPAPYSGVASPLSMTYRADAGVFDFVPLRDESDATLTLRLTFDDGSQAVAKFAGAAADLGRTAVDPRVGQSSVNVSTAADLVAAVAADSPVIHLAAGTYVLNGPLVLDAPVSITADAGATLVFALSDAAGSPWKSATGAIIVQSSHVALDGFAIRFSGTTASWTAPSRNVIQAGLGSVDVDLSFTNLDVVAPAAAVSTGYEAATQLMNFNDGDTGVIAYNTLTGGMIQLGAAPWKVLDNDYRGAVAHTITPTFLNAYRSFDLTIKGNHAHQVDPLGIAQRFLVMGNSDTGQGIGNVISGNVIDGGIGTPTTGAPAGYTNNPEIILTETYQPRFEGIPSAVSPDGSIVQIPYLRGPVAHTGDIVSILTGPYAGQWRMIAQALSPTQYLLDSPLPAGSFAISIGRGYVDQKYDDNTIDLRGMSADNTAIVISGNHWGQSIDGNTFLGGQALRLGAGSNEGAFESQYPAPWGWSRLPVLGLSIQGNAFIDAGVNLSVAHDATFNKSSAGRTYFEGDFSDNYFSWTDPAKAVVVIGTPGYTTSAYPWLTPMEMVLTATGNWGLNASTGQAASLQVYAAQINGSAASGTSVILPTSTGLSGVSLGQDGHDVVGSGPWSPAPNGYQDVHIVIRGLAADKEISELLITADNGHRWSYSSPFGPDRLVVIRAGATADVYIQPYQDETDRTITIFVRYADGSTAQTVIYGLTATARLHMPTNAAGSTSTSTSTTTSPAIVSARGDNAAAGEGTVQAFDGDPTTKWLDFAPTSWLQYQFGGGGSVVVTGYTITSANDTALYPGRAPNSWALLGSNDGVNWTTLDVRSNAAVTTDYTATTYTFANSTAYRIYRLASIVSNGDSIIQIAELALLNAQGQKVS